MLIKQSTDKVYGHRVRAHQIGDGDEKIVKDTFTEESLDETAAWASVATTDLDGLPDGHGGDDGVEEQRRDLRSMVNG